MDEFVKLQNITKIYKMGEVEIRAADGISFYVRKRDCLPKLWKLNP